MALRRLIDKGSSQIGHRKQGKNKKNGTEKIEKF